MTPLIIHVEQLSLEAFDNTKQTTSDLEDAFEREPHAVAMTEATRAGHRTVATATAKDYGYQLRGGIGDTAIAVRRDVGVWRFESLEAHGGGRDSYGAYSTRTLEVLTADIEGEQVTFIEGHWVRPRTAERRKRHAIMTDLAIRTLTEHTAGNKLGVLLGDLNENLAAAKPGPAKAAFTKAGITTAWDAIGRHDVTGPGGGTIDLAATRDADTRMRALAVNTWPLGQSDHPAISFLFGVRRPS